MNKTICHQCHQEKSTKSCIKQTSRFFYFKECSSKRRRMPFSVERVFSLRTYHLLLPPSPPPLLLPPLPPHPSPFFFLLSFFFLVDLKSFFGNKNCPLLERRLVEGKDADFSPHPTPLPRGTEPTSRRTEREVDSGPKGSAPKVGLPAGRPSS